MSDGTFGSIQSALGPRIKLGGSQGPVEFGIDLDVPDKANILGSPKSIWGQTTASVAGWSVKSRAEYTEGKYDYSSSGKRGVYLTLEAEDDSQQTFLWGSGEASTSGARPLKLGAKKVIPVQGSKIMVEPRYNFASTGADVCLGYEREVLGQDTRLYLTASASDQNLKVVRNLGDSNAASVKVGRSGFMAATLENDSDLGSTKLTVEPGAVDAELNQDGWVAGIRVDKPFFGSEPTVRFAKKFSFSA